MNRYEVIPLSSREVKVFRSDQPSWIEDHLAIEEPLEIRLRYKLEGDWKEQGLSITMRSPGNDLELSVGFLFTEGIIKSAEEIKSIRSCGPRGKEAKWQNIVKVELTPECSVDLQKLHRHFYTTSSCGICGKSSIDAIKTLKPETFQAKEIGNEWSIKAELLYQLPDRLREAQKAFSSTGGLHASGLFTCEGELLILREDVGRHNALDKIIGGCFQNSGLPLREKVLLLSGRASFELIQKAAMAGVEFVAAIGAPSSLAVELAKDLNMTLVGFLRGKNFNVYSDRGRIL